MNTMANLNEPILPGTAATDYERYLRTDELLSLQKSAQEVSHRDEHLFQAVHQTSELWLKFACGELERRHPAGRIRAGRRGDSAAPPRERHAQSGDRSAPHARAHVADRLRGGPDGARPRRGVRFARLPPDTPSDAAARRRFRATAGDAPAHAARGLRAGSLTGQRSTSSPSSSSPGTSGRSCGGSIT